MRKIKPFLMIIMTLLMALSVWKMHAVSVYAASSGTSGTCTWEIDDDGVLTIRPTNGVSGTLARLNDSAWVQAKSVIVQNGVKAPLSSDDLFLNMNNCTEMDLRGLDTSSTTSMVNMFNGCTALVSLDLSSFDTSNVTNMLAMFRNCPQLKELDLSTFDTAKVIYMDNMFEGCYNLTELDLTHFDTSHVTGMSNMFGDCNDLTELDVSNFDTSHVTDMSNMFHGCTSLAELDVSNFETSNVTNMSMMFCGCQFLAELDVSNFETSNVTDMSKMFQTCSTLTELDVSNFDTSDVTNMNAMFKGCDSLTELEVSGFDTANATDMSDMFSGCDSLTELDVSGFDTANVTNMTSMFESCSNITELDVSGFDTANVTYMTNMFLNCFSLTELDVSEFTTSNVRSMRSMFSGCKELTMLDVSNFDTSNVTDMYCMFSNCASLTELDVSSFDTSKVTTMENMFESCSNLTELDVSGFNTSNVTNMLAMFESCSNITELDVSSFDTSKVTTMESMFASCSNLTELDVSEFTTSNVRSMRSMFSHCEKLTMLDVSNFETSNVTDMSKMFQACSNLTELDVSNFDTSGVTNMYEMFCSCSSLESLNISSFDTSSISSPSYYINRFFGELPNLIEIDLGPDFHWYYEAGDFGRDPIEGYTTNWVRSDGAYGPFASNGEFRGHYNANPNAMQGKWVREVDSRYLVVHYDANGGITSEDDVTVQSPDRAVAIADGTNTHRPFYDFAGWNTAADGSGTAYAPDAIVTTFPYGQRTTLYAQWVEEPYKVSYKVNHYQQSANDPSEYKLAASETFREEPGTSVTPSTKEYEYFVIPATQTITLEDNNTQKIDYYYDRIRYNVHFDGNGATSGTMPDQEMVPSVSRKLAENQFEKENAFFYGWNTEADGSGTSYSDKQSTNFQSANGATITLYAQWSEIEAIDIPTNGELVVSMKAGETIIFPDLPAGISYSIEEIGNPNGWTYTEGTNTEGTIEVNGSVSASITNTYSAEGTVAIVAHKRLNGDTLNAGQFSFLLYDESGTLVGTASNGALDQMESYTDDEDQTVANPWYQTAPIYFPDLTFDAPGEYHYTIVESKIADPAVAYDSHRENVTVNAVDNGNGTLNCQVIYDRDGALFTNRIRTGSLTVSKTVENATANAENAVFTFTVSLTDSNGTPLTANYPVTMSDGSTTTITDGGTIAIGGGESFEIRDLPHGARYAVSEGTVPGFEQTSVENATGTIDVTSEQAVASFTNTYIAVGSVQIEAIKTLEGGILEGDTYQFELTDESGTVIDTQYANASGNIKFAPIDYGPSDNGKTYTYYITEVNGGDNNITYDEHIEAVNVVITDDGQGKMTADVEYDNDGASFHNVMLVSNTTYTLTLEKEVYSNINDTSGSFPFVVNIGGEERTVTLANGESITFNGLLDGTAYTITEPNMPASKVSFTINGVVTTGNSVTGTISAQDGDVTVLCTNRKDAIIPTNVTTRNVVVTAMIAFGAILAATAVFMLRKKRGNLTSK